MGIMTVQGVRLPDAVVGEAGPGWRKWDRAGVIAPPGSYMRVDRRNEEGDLILFAIYAVLPDGIVCSILPSTHAITEHDDATITVSPSIHDAPDGWHGYLRAGVWSEA